MAEPCVIASGGMRGSGLRRWSCHLLGLVLLLRTTSGQRAVGNLGALVERIDGVVELLQLPLFNGHDEEVGGIRAAAEVDGFLKLVNGLLGFALAEVDQAQTA